MTLYVCLKTAFINNVYIRVLLAMPILLSTYLNEMFYYLSHDSLAYSDMTNLWLSRAEYQSAISSYSNIAIPSITFVIIGAIAFYIPVVKQKNSSYTLSKIFIGNIILLVALIGGVTLKGGAAAKGFPEQFKTSFLFLKVVADEFQDDFNQLRTKAPFNTVIQKDPPNIVYIVDESVRGDFIDINNPKWNTTPFLLSIKDSIVNYGYAASGHTCSHFSNAMLRHGVSQKQLSHSLKTRPSLWDFALKAQYHTVYFDAQKRLGTLQNFMESGERKLINDHIQFDVDQVEKLDAFVRKDHQAAIDISALLSKSEPQFIYLNKEGVHMPYEGKYPSDHTLFEPHMKLNQSISKNMDKTLLINSYRNAIHWSVDLFFKELIERIDLTKTIIIYTSDHGQNLLDKGLGTHCSSGKPHENVGVVPLFIITEHPVKRKLLQAQPEFFNESSHFNIAPTILTILNYDQKYITKNYDPSFFSKPNKERVFYSGNITNNNIKEHKITKKTELKN